MKSAVFGFSIHLLLRFSICFLALGSGQRVNLIKGRSVLFGKGVVVLGFPFTSASLLAQSHGEAATWKQGIFCHLSLNKSISGNNLELAFGEQCFPTSLALFLGSASL